MQPKMPPGTKEYSKLYNTGRMYDPETLEDRKDYLSLAKYVYGLYCSQSLHMYPGAVNMRGRSLGELRKYALCAQETEKYKTQITRDMTDGSDPELSKKFNYQNISWEPVMVMDKFRNIVVSKLTAPEFDTSVIATDTYSNAERQREIALDRINSSRQMMALSQQAGIPSGVSPMVQALDGDVDTAVAIGAYLLPIEAQMQDAIRVTMDANSWSVIKKQVAEDIHDYNMTALRIDFEEEEGCMHLKYIDPAGLILPASKYEDCRDVPFIGYLEHAQIGHVREELLEGGEYSEKDIYKLAKTYGSYYPNIPRRNSIPTESFSDTIFRQDYAANRGHQIYDPFTILIMHLYKICCIEVDGKNIQVVKKLKWVVNTDIVYEYGIDGSIAREGKPGSKKARLPIVAWAGHGPSVVEKCIAAIDDLNIAVLKLRALINNLPAGERRTINLSLLRNTVNIGDKNYSMLDMLAVEQMSGTLIIEGRGEFDDMDVRASNQNPVTPNNSTVSGDIILYESHINRAMAIIRDNTGINEVADGTTQTRDLLIGVMDGMQQISNASLNTYFSGIQSMFFNTTKTIGYKYQTAVLNGDIQLTSIRHTATGLHAVNLTKDISYRDIEFLAIPSMSDEDINLTMQMVVARVQQNELSQADMTVIITMLRARNIKMASLYMAKAIQINKERQSKEAQANIMAQAQSQAELSKVQEEEKRKTIQFKEEEIRKTKVLEQQLELEKMREAVKAGINAKAFEIAAGQQAIK